MGSGGPPEVRGAPHIVREVERHDTVACSNQANAFEKSPFSIIDREELHFFLKAVSDDDVFVVALSCKPFYEGLKLQDRCKKGHGIDRFKIDPLGHVENRLFKTPITGLFSSWERFLFATVTLKENGPVFKRRMANLAAQAGALDVLKNLYYQGHDLKDACAGAATKGNLKCLVYAFTHEPGKNLNDVWQRASSAGQLSSLEMLSSLFKLYGDQMTLDEECMNLAAKGGHTDCLKFLRDNRFPWPSGVILSCAGSGNAECLRYAFNNGARSDSRQIYIRQCYEAAALGGHLECVKVLHENGFEMSRKLCEQAASVGSLECLKYAHEKGCPWDAETCIQAVMADSLDCLQYAHRNGCSLDEGIVEKAAYDGKSQCLKYALENRFPRGLWSTLDFNSLSADIQHMLKTM